MGFFLEKIKTPQKQNRNKFFSYNLKNDANKSFERIYLLIYILVFIDYLTIFFFVMVSQIKNINENFTNGSFFLELYEHITFILIKFLFLKEELE